MDKEWGPRIHRQKVKASKCVGGVLILLIKKCKSKLASFDGPGCHLMGINFKPKKYPMMQ